MLTDAAGSNVTTRTASQKDVEIAMRKFFTGARDRGIDGRKRSKATPPPTDQDNDHD